MKIVILNNLHGNLPKIEECDYVIIAGNISSPFIQSNRAVFGEWLIHTFAKWVINAPCKKVLFVPGDKDVVTDKKKNKGAKELITQLNVAACSKLILLDNDNFDIKVSEKSKLRMWGFPYTLDTNSPYKIGYEVDEKTLNNELSKIKDNVHILITSFDISKQKHFIEKLKTLPNLKVIFFNNYGKVSGNAGKIKIISATYCDKDCISITDEPIKVINI